VNPVRKFGRGFPVTNPAGYYTKKNAAIYWDGRNDSGELVASGIYFYSIKAGDFTATKKLLILK